MAMDGADIGIISGGGTAALGFVLGVVQRYVAPRLTALRERLDKLEERLYQMDKRQDELQDSLKAGLLEQREITGLKVTEAHIKLDKESAAIRAELAKVRETVGYLRGRTTQRRKD